MLNFAICLILIISTIFGARLEITAISYVFIAAVILIGYFVATKDIDKKYYSLYIFTIALCTFWQVSLLGQQVVGNDVHSEFYVSSLTLQSGLNLNSPEQYNTSIAVTIIAPFLAQFISLVWVYKILFPLCLAFVPFIMYYVFKKQMNEEKAFWATLFFIVVPIISLEIIGISKSIMAELFLSLFLLVMVSNIRFKYIYLPILVILTILSHYTVGFILLGYLLGSIIILAFGKLYHIKGKVGLVILSLTLVISVGVGYLYYINIVAGTRLFNVIVTTTENILPNNGDNVLVATNEEKENTISTIVDNQQDLAKVGTGLDLGQSSTVGIIFRIIQYLTEILIVLGIIQLWRKRKTYKFAPEFIAMMLVGFFMIGVALVVPYFSLLINMTRIYQLSLFFLAPLFVLGCDLLWDKKWVLPSILFVYYVFTSGLVFELINSNKTNVLDIPYSVALSYQRTGIGGVVNQDDVNCAEWVASHGDEKIMSGYNTAFLLLGYVGRSDRVFNQTTYMPFSLYDNSKGYYFVSSWESENDKTIKYVDIGLRQTVPIPDYVNKLPIVYQSGNSIVREKY